MSSFRYCLLYTSNRVSQLQGQLSDCIRKTAEESKKTVRIVTQEKKKDQALNQTAQNYHISSGKLQFIRMMTAAYPDLDEETLSKMSMEELYRIILDREKEKPAWLQMNEEDWNEYKEEMKKEKDVYKRQHYQFADEYKIVRKQM